MIRRTPARYLAPLALIAFVVAGVLAISAANKDSKTSTTQAPVVHRHVPKVYKVRPGDSLPGISERYGVPVTRILELNPEVDPRALDAGHQLQLR